MPLIFGDVPRMLGEEDYLATRLLAMSQREARRVKVIRNMINYGGY